jgi:hypothetical protein
MVDTCSCGSLLVPGALFCHKCGKPVRELTSEPESTASIPVMILEPVAPPVSFQNRAAVRVAFMVALVTTVLSWIPLLNIVLWGAGGFFAVFLYRKRTGVLLNVRAGVSLGWITGVMMFVLTTVIFTVTVVPIAASGGIATMFRSQFKNPSDPSVQEALRMLDTAPGLVAILFATLLMLFVLITLLSMAGAALGAKLAGGSSARPAA